MKKLIFIYNNMKYNIKPILSGIEIGVPVHLLTFISNNINKYPINTANFNNQILLNYLLTFACYKLDRYSDYQEYNINFKNNNNNLNYDESKIKLYNSFSNNEKLIRLTLFVTYLSLFIIIIDTKQTYYLPLFLTTFNYKLLKKNLPYFKSLYLSTIWSLTCTILPFIKYSDFNELITYNCFIPVFLNIFATTNIADFKDIDEDKSNNVKTLPIIIGKKKSIKLIILTSLLSILFFISLDNFNNNIFNDIFIASNIFPILNFINFTK